MLHRRLPKVGDTQTDDHRPPAMQATARTKKNTTDLECSGNLLVTNVSNMLSALTPVLSSFQVREVLCQCLEVANNVMGGAMVLTRPTHGTEATSTIETVCMLSIHATRTSDNRRPGSSTYGYKAPTSCMLRHAVLRCITCHARQAQIHSCTLLASRAERLPSIVKGWYSQPLHTKLCSSHPTL